MKIAIVILNWNGKQLLETFLPSVLAFSKEATVYVADNASTDDSVSYLAVNFPEVTIIQNKINGGYAKGYNEALKNLQEDIFVLLNSDVEVTQNWLSPIVEAFKTTPNLVAAQPKILDYKNKDYFEYAGAAGGYIDKLGYPFCRGRIFNTIEKDTGQYNDEKTIFWASGACLFIKKDAFEKVNGFDEDFFAHQEEIDLCWRLQSNGGVIKYVGASKVYHVGGATLATENPKKTFYNFRNTLLMLLKNIKGPKVFFILLIRMLLDGLAATQFLIQGKFKHIGAIFKAHISFYTLFYTFLKKRKLYASNFEYFNKKTVVWLYFARNKRRFNDL
ncbi:glycosyltransferase family 2 protein [Marixanthomonas ophiurae]|uniref:Glycosyltransferase family 2 protein n=1 Tax=Marixanthomonas ophiurae TaxID=387659 RepID=A0A3E1QDE2_9FLAO|nr:glycosyltransferase family 2 protein [Marixanthomonas ophiurae]RFN60179.1 glycosyltransferase family 2 protein [Marixanthomonas ophiurae]